MTIRRAAFPLRTLDPRLPHGLTLGSRAGYVGSMGATLYAALVMHSYIMSLICCAVQACLVTPLRHPVPVLHCLCQTSHGHVRL